MPSSRLTRLVPIAKWMRVALSVLEKGFCPTLINYDGGNDDCIDAQIKGVLVDYRPQLARLTYRWRFRLAESDRFGAKCMDRPIWRSANPVNWISFGRWCANLLTLHMQAN